MSFFEELKRRNVFKVGLAYTVLAWLVAQVSEMLLGAFGAPEWVFKTLLMLLMIGFPLALFFAWAFELTPEGIKKEKDVDRSQSIIPKTGRKIDFMIIGVMAVALAYFIWESRFSEPTEPVSVGAETSDEAAQDELPSVAVLPFVNMSANADNEYFSDGLTETLLHILAQLPDLKVAARTSAFAFKGTNTDIREIGSTLGVEHVLEGSVQRSGDRVRITAQLIRADDGFHVWSEVFDRTLEDIFAIQDEIANEVASALSDSIGANSIGRVATRNLGAYDLYLKGLAQQAIGSYGSLTEAESLFIQSLAADPTFVDAKLALAYNYYLQAYTGLMTIVQAHEKTAPVLDQVLQTAPDNLEAKVLRHLDSYHWASDTGDYSAMKAEYQAVMSLMDNNPGLNFALDQVGNIATWIFGDYDLAEAMARRGLDRDPLFAELHSVLALSLSKQGDIDGAQNAIETALHLNPDSPLIILSMHEIQKDRNQMDQAVYYLIKAAEVDPQDHEIPAQIAEYLYLLDLPESAGEWASKAKAMAPEEPATQRLNLFQAYALGGEEAAAEVSLKMIEGDIGIRGLGILEALRFYANYSQSIGKEEQAITLLKIHYPFMDDPVAKPEKLEGYDAEVWVAKLSMASNPEFDGASAADMITNKWLSHGIELDEFGWSHVDLALMRGDLEAATEFVMKEYFDQPWAVNYLSSFILGDFFYQPLTQVPEIAAKLDEYERDRQRQRAATITMLEALD